MEMTTYQGEKINLGEFTVDDFVSVIFPGAQKSMRATSLVIVRELKEGPKTISEIVDKCKLPRGTAYDAAKKMQRLGIIDREGKYTPVRLSGKFSLSLERLSLWYRDHFRVKKRG
ncbi:MAG: winged helix-turn-helix transcriptional regulator [Candidatus Aenigmarchaeota archaeon]|nr:winged helix-turn-helix transcriptional regulator [Candidatus Aenigmarchaeota archaeon]